MSEANNCQSALFMSTSGNDDDAAVLVVGGCGGDGKEAELLTNRPLQRRGEQGRGGRAWRWRQLSPMLKTRWCSPGALLLGSERALVVGGALGNYSNCRETTPTWVFGPFSLNK